ncbi:MAG: hypothetical protein DMG98_08180 [Acidobacteria bacterium]|nr:MAG: hypothetical protein DMG98_08180 [Acidobacteriota bacterium]
MSLDNAVVVIDGMTKFQEELRRAKSQQPAAAFPPVQNVSTFLYLSQGRKVIVNLLSGSHDN